MKSQKLSTCAQANGKTHCWREFFTTAEIEETKYHLSYLFRTLIDDNPQIRSLHNMIMAFVAVFVATTVGDYLSNSDRWVEWLSRTLVCFENVTDKCFLLLIKQQQIQTRLCHSPVECSRLLSSLSPAMDGDALYCPRWPLSTRLFAQLPQSEKCFGRWKGEDEEETFTSVDFNCPQYCIFSPHSHRSSVPVHLVSTASHKLWHVHLLCPHNGNGLFTFKKV